jgi:hypothetical protein
MKTLTITPPEGYEIDEKLSTFQNIVFKESELPKRLEYEDLYPQCGNVMVDGPLAPNIKYNQAYKALCKLLFLSEHKNFNGQPQSEWVDCTHRTTHSIVLHTNNLYISENLFLKRVLTFKTRELAKKFLKDYEQELLIAAPLL